MHTFLIVNSPSHHRFVIAVKAKLQNISLRFPKFSISSVTKFENGKNEDFIDFEQTRGMTACNSGMVENVQLCDCRQ